MLSAAANGNEKLLPRPKIAENAPEIGGMTSGVPSADGRGSSVGIAPPPAGLAVLTGLCGDSTPPVQFFPPLRLHRFTPISLSAERDTSANETSSCTCWSLATRSRLTIDGGAS